MKWFSLMMWFVFLAINGSIAGRLCWIAKK